MTLWVATCRLLLVIKSRILQVLEERQKLHREHEQLFDSEVLKLVELNNINKLPAVTRMRSATICCSHVSSSHSVASHASTMKSAGPRYSQ